MSEPSPDPSGPLPLRWAYLLAGWAFLALGIAGAFLPGVPTTVFLILALWAWARSSRRLHDWLYHHPRLGPPLQRWARHRVVPLRVKWIAWTSMAASTSWLFWRGDVPWPVLAATVALVAYGVWFLARCPSHPPADG